MPDVLAGAAWTLHRLNPLPTPDDTSSPESGILGAGIPARVAGTVTGALRDAFGEPAVDRALVSDATWEYRTRITTPGGTYRITSPGVASVAELRVAGELVASSTSAFAPWDVLVRLPPGDCEIALRLLPLDTVPVPRKPRARWLSPLVSDRALRRRRTPLIGHIDWPGARLVIGPWGGLSAVAVPQGDREAGVEPGPLAIRTRLDAAGDGIVNVDLRVRSVGRPTRVRLDCAGAVAERAVTVGEADSNGVVTVSLAVARPERWWPHGTGEPALHELRVDVAGSVSEHRVGFRTVTAEPRTSRSGLALRVNDVAVFARGAVWSGADRFEVAADPEAIRDTLRTLRAGGATMIRVPGTGCYETDAFHRACDDLGLMVWQDVALGPMDPPEDPEWRAGLHEEVRALAARLAAHPSTVVLSGGTEVIQAPVLAGRPAREWVSGVLLEEVPRAAQEAGADVVVVASSPCSGEALDLAARIHEASRPGSGTISDPVPTRGLLPEVTSPAEAVPTPDSSRAQEPPLEAGRSAVPTAGLMVPASSPVDADDGVCHYFGVGAYGRPLEDARHAGVRFAAECLAFAVPPEPAVVRAQFGTDGPLDDPAAAAAWRTGLARDPGAAWTFEDTTTSYVRRLFCDPDSDPDAGLAAPARPGAPVAALPHAQRLEYQRAALAHVFQRTLAEWRRADSPCRGALVLAARSTAAGAGWGILDVAGHPTAAWYGMRRACAPTAVTILPEGGNGLPVHVWHDGPEPLTATLRLTVATVGGGCQQPLEILLTVPARGERVIRADLADGTFRDLAHAYGFGAREYEGVRAELIDADGRLLARDVHLTGGPRRDDIPDPGLTAQWTKDADGQWAVAVSSSGLARFVSLDLPVGLVAEDGYVHLLPGDTVRLPVNGVDPAGPPRGPGRDARVRVLDAEPVPVG